MHACGIPQSCQLPSNLYLELSTYSIGSEIGNYHVRGIVSYNDTPLTTLKSGAAGNTLKPYISAQNPNYHQTWEGCNGLLFALARRPWARDGLNAGEDKIHSINFQLFEAQHENKVLVHSTSWAVLKRNINFWKLADLSLTATAEAKAANSPDLNPQRPLHLELQH